MSALSDYAENLIATWLTSASAATRPTAWYVALYTSATDDAAGGTELSGNGYTRQSVTFTAPSGGQVTNSAVVTFGPCTGTAWGTVTHFAVYDAAASGNRLFHGALSSPRTIAVGDSLQILTNQLSFTLA